MVEVDLGDDAAGGTAGGRPDDRVRGRPRGRRRDRGRQAGRARRPPRRRQPDGTLVNGLLARYPELAAVGDPMRPGIVHRLDAGSSGLLVVARTDAADGAGRAVRRAHRRPALRRRRVGPPRVTARDHRRPDRARPGRPAADGRRRRGPAGPHRVPGARALRQRRGRWPACRACWRPGGRTRSASTSPPSAIRCVGDPTYGERRTTLGLERPFLHAAELSFDHPTTGDRLTFTSPLPADLSSFLATLEPAHPSV